MSNAPALLKQWRKASGFSQSVCAKRIGVTQASWNTWENGVRSPQIEHALAMQDLTEGAVPVEAWRSVVTTGTDG